jgi:hypothetical protein
MSEPAKTAAASGAMVAPPEIGAPHDGLVALEDAPGSYVQRR